MANRITHELNGLLRNVQNIEDYYTKGYLYDILSFECFEKKHKQIEDINTFYRVLGFELHQDTERSKEKMSSISKQLLGLSKEFPMALIVMSDDEGKKLYLGSNYVYAPQIKQVLINNISSIQLSNEWIKPSTLRENQKYNGCIVGVSSLEAEGIDEILHFVGNEHSLLSFLFMPIQPQNIKLEINEIDSLIEAYQKVAKNDYVIGSTRSRKYENENQCIKNVLEILEIEKERLKRGQIQGLWQVFIQISAPSQIEYEHISSALVSVFRKNSALGKQNVLSQALKLDAPIIEKTVWNIPDDFVGKESLGELYKSSFLNVCNMEEASSMLQLPCQPHKGYSIIHIGDSPLSSGAFYPFSNRENKLGSFELGKLENGDNVYVDLDCMRQHVFITGSTRCGKSTTVRRLLWEAQQRDTPFVVVEAAKKDYWELVNCAGMDNLKIYSAGDDACPLKINPFQPEDNTLLDVHIQNLIRAFLSLFDSEDPLPQIISDLVYRCYEKKGWNVEKRVKKDMGLGYPTLSDMLLYLDECLDDIGYEEEVRNNMRGVVKLRLTALLRQADRSLNTEKNISMEEMFKTSAVVELEDFSDANKPFVASILAIRINEYSKQKQMSNHLQRLFVVEEAHHLLPNPELKSATKTAALCSSTFSNLLAEISAYGTGAIIVDQRPSLLTSAVLANTSMKVIHNIHEGEDIRTITNSLSLSNIEANVINKLKVGQAILSLPQSPYLNRVAINGAIAKQSFQSLARIFASNFSIDGAIFISNFEKSTIENFGFNVETIGRCVRAIEEKEYKEFNREEKIAIIGELAKLSTASDQNKRQQFFEYLDQNNLL